MPDALNFQRAGSTSNTQVGAEFESIVQSIVDGLGISTSASFAVDVGNGQRRKAHRFDLGSNAPPTLIECKSHTWTSGGNSPSAKLTVWNEAMYYFALSPARYRKMFFVLKDMRGSESLAEYYVRRYGHMIPENVEVWEYCPHAGQAAMIFAVK